MFDAAGFPTRVRRGNEQIPTKEGRRGSILDLNRTCSPVVRRRGAALAIVVLVATVAATAQAAPPTTDGPTPATAAPEDTTEATVTDRQPPVGSAPAASGISSEPFGEVDGEAVELYTLTNANGMEVKIMTYGGIIQSVRVPDRDGNLSNVTLNTATLDDYVDGHPYFGASPAATPTASPAARSPSTGRCTASP